MSDKVGELDEFIENQGTPRLGVYAYEAVLLQLARALQKELHTLRSENDTLRIEYEQLREWVERLEHPKDCPCHGKT